MVVGPFFGILQPVFIPVPVAQRPDSGSDIPTAQTVPLASARTVVPQYPQMGSQYGQYAQPYGQQQPAYALSPAQQQAQPGYGMPKAPQSEFDTNSLMSMSLMSMMSALMSMFFADRAQQQQPPQQTTPQMPGLPAQNRYGGQYGGSPAAGPRRTGGGLPLRANNSVAPTRQAPLRPVDRNPQPVARQQATGNAGNADEADNRTVQQNNRQPAPERQQAAQPQPERRQQPVNNGQQGDAGSAQGNAGSAQNAKPAGSGGYGSGNSASSQGNAGSAQTAKSSNAGGYGTGNAGGSNNAQGAQPATGAQASQGNNNQGQAGTAQNGAQAPAGQSDRPDPSISGQVGQKAPPAKIDKEDFKDFLLAGSKGGTETTSERIDDRYARPGSKFGNTGANEFDAVTAHAYSVQFKAYALGKDAVMAPGKDLDQLAQNLVDTQETKFTPEADLLSKVAATYRGDFGNASLYNNGELKNLLNQWGREDIANEPLVGDPLGDVQSIGGAIKALNEEPNADRRKQMLNDVFDFENNTPNSPSGAVPNVNEYVDAINIVQNGTLDRLVDNYNKGIKTNAAIDRSAPGSFDAQALDPRIDFRELSSDERSAMGLNDRDRAVLHLWGRQMIAEGKQNGAILNTVMDTVNGAGDGQSVVAKQAEVDLARELISRDQAEFGGITGKSLDQEFFKVFQKITGKDISAKYSDTPVEFANGRRALLPDADVDSADWERQLQQNNGLNGTENALLRLWGHDPLMNGGRIDGSILAYTLEAGDSPLDRGLNKGIVEDLLKSDLMSDGIVNGDSLEFGFGKVLDKLYNKGPTTTLESIRTHAMETAQRIGRTAQQIASDTTTGVQKALDDVSNFVQNHPVATAASVGGMLAATAVCPFLAGLGAAGGALAGNRNRQAA
jgi:hypothetical protein